GSGRCAPKRAPNITLAQPFPACSSRAGFGLVEPIPFSRRAPDGPTSLRAPKRGQRRLRPEQDEAHDRAGADDDHGREHEHVLRRQLEQPCGRERREDAERSGEPEECAAHGRDYPVPVAEPNYWSGEDYVVEFLGYRFGFNAEDFEQRVTAAAVKLGLL